MNKNLIIGIIAILILVGGGMYVAHSNSEKVETEKAAMMKKDEDAKMMKEKEDAVMKKTDEKMDGGKDEKAMMGTGYIFKNGKMMVDTDGKMSPMTQSVTLKNGSSVSLAGLVTKKDGTTFQLKEGQSIWEDGSIVTDPSMMKEKEDAAMEK